MAVTLITTIDVSNFAVEFLLTERRKRQQETALLYLTDCRVRGIVKNSKEQFSYLHFHCVRASAASSQNTCIAWQSADYVSGRDL